MKDVPPHLREKKYLVDSLTRLLDEQEEAKQRLATLEELQRKKDETGMES